MRTFQHRSEITARSARSLHHCRVECGTSGEDAWHALASRIAPLNCAVLLSGETGSGKGFAARWIHEHSDRRDKPMVPVNCGAIPDSLIDSQLFGHARGAFSGADRAHEGLVRAADGGTLLLDEIADLPLASQSRLLRLLEEREVQPVGFSRPIKVDVRIIAATSADLAKRTADGTFRQDLLFRLDVVRLHVPPLRERRESIVPLMQRFNAEFASTYRQRPLEFGVDALDVLESHDWPGNVRELRTVVERLHVLCGRDHRITTRADVHTFGGIGAARAQGLNVRSAADRLAELKLESVNQALDASAGSMSRAAAALGVHRSTLYRWLQTHQAVTA